MERFYKIMKEDICNMSHEDRFCIYIDFPFCTSICKYCVFNSIKLTNDYRKEYVSALINQIKSLQELLTIKTPDSLYFGGGTPSLFTFDELQQIKDNIPNYHKIKTIKTEAHPIDLNDKRIAFYSKEMLIDVVSLGIQSFNNQSCTEQNRLWVSPTHVKEIVQLLHSHNIYVNIDLVALFNGDSEENWSIYECDLKTATSIVEPDIITSVVNYNTKLNYSDEVIKLRNILAREVGKSYYPSNKGMLSTNMKDVARYRNNDHWIATKSYWDYQQNSVRYNGSIPKLGKSVHQATLSFGGANMHKVYSFPSSMDCICLSHYNFIAHKFDYTIKYSE